MRFFLVTLLVAAAVADRLENTYLPPNSAPSAGGSDGSLTPPVDGGAPPQIPSTSYGTPTIQYGPPSNKYGPPSSKYGPPSTKYGVPSGRPSKDASATTLRFNNENSGDGNYKFDFETSNKISQQEQGSMRSVGGEKESSVVEGTYSYEGPDGRTYTVHYIADDQGFRATGDHLPTPPPIPVEIQKALDRMTSGGGSESRKYLPPNNDNSDYPY